MVGLGDTGLSCARFLARRGITCAVADTRAAPPALGALQRELPAVPVHLGAFEPERFASCQTLVVSPGVSLREPAIAAARRAGREIIGDVELFARHARAPVAAITGSNGKSTVTTLLAHVLRCAGHRVLAGGNLGPPALELLAQPTPDCYVLELSSFQLEALYTLRPQAASVINISPDHLDRYASAAEYARAKARIYRGARHCVYNADDAATRAGIPRRARRNSFTLARPRALQFGVRSHRGECWLAQGARVLVPARGLRLRGRHNLANALAALALADALGADVAAAASGLESYHGLAHRMRVVRERRGVTWIDDSKGTNVGATAAALAGAGASVVLIAGGDGKGADFAPLRAAVVGKVHAVVLIGRDAPRIAAVLAGVTRIERAADMAQAVRRADALARPGDEVLLSPACASFDMFANYQARGAAFAAAVQALPA